MIPMGEAHVYGTMGILNVGAGDTKLSFDPNNPAERIRAARIVADMLRRGYALLVEVGPPEDRHFVRATEFREDTCEYIIADFDPTIGEQADREEVEADEPTAASPATPAGEEAASALPPERKRRGRPPKVIEASTTRAVAVARSAGG